MIPAVAPSTTKSIPASESDDPDTNAREPFHGSTHSGGTMDFFDPDGPGPLPTVTFNPSTPAGSYKGYAVVYDMSTWAVQQSVTWESTQGYERCDDITVTPDGGFIVVGTTHGDMGGYTNPAPGTSEGYMEKYNADGSLDLAFP